MSYYEEDGLSNKKNDMNKSELENSVNDWNDMCNKVKGELLNRLLDEILKEYNKQ